MATMISKGTKVLLKTINGGECVVILTHDYKPTYPTTFERMEGGEFTVMGDRIKSIEPYVMGDEGPQAEDAIAVARKYVNNGAAMQSSALLCLQDAEALAEKYRFADAKRRALHSLEYSVGIFNAEYRRLVG
jgi:hypothetical protein